MIEPPSLDSRPRTGVVNGTMDSVAEFRLVERKAADALAPAGDGSPGIGRRLMLPDVPQRWHS